MNIMTGLSVYACMRYKFCSGRSNIDYDVSDGGKVANSGNNNLKRRTSYAF